MQEVVQLKAKVPQTLKRQAFSVMAHVQGVVAAHGNFSVTTVVSKA